MLPPLSLIILPRVIERLSSYRADEMQSHMVYCGGAATIPDCDDIVADVGTTATAIGSWYLLRCTTCAIWTAGIGGAVAAAGWRGGRGEAPTPPPVPQQCVRRFLNQHAHESNTMAPTPPRIAAAQSRVCCVPLRVLASLPQHAGPNAVRCAPSDLFSVDGGSVHVVLFTSAAVTLLHSVLSVLPRSHGDSTEQVVATPGK